MVTGLAFLIELSLYSAQYLVIGYKLHRLFVMAISQSHENGVLMHSILLCFSIGE